MCFVGSSIAPWRAICFEASRTHESAGDVLCQRVDVQVDVLADAGGL